LCAISSKSSRIVTVDLPATSTPLGGAHCIKWGTYGQANTFPQTFANSQYGSYGNGEYPYFELLGDGAAPQGPLSTTTPPACAQDCNDNVLFIPGIEASRLYRPDNNGGTNRLWEPSLGGSDATELKLDASGVPLHTDIYTKDVIDHAYVPGKGNVYESFIADMNTLKATGKIADREAARALARSLAAR
jgi:hypothetical protein